MSAAAFAPLALVRHIRRLMGDMGYTVRVWPEPRIVIEAQAPGEAGSYSPGANLISLPEGHTQATLWHEVCHSQQPPGTAATAIAYRRADGAIDSAAWDSDPREQQAECIGMLADRADWRDLVELCAGMAVAQQRALLTWIVLGGGQYLPGRLRCIVAPPSDFGRCAAIVRAAAAATQDPAQLMSWVDWIARGEMAYHPERLPRRARQAVNAAQAALWIPA